MMNFHESITITGEGALTADGGQTTSGKKYGSFYQGYAFTISDSSIVTADKSVLTSEPIMEEGATLNAFVNVGERF